MAALPAPVAAQPLSLADMLARDELNRPAEELAAWQAFAAEVLADPAAAPDLRAEAHLGLATSLLYDKQFAAGFAESEAADALVAAMAQPTAFAARSHVIAALLLTELGRLEEAQARAMAGLALAEASGNLRDQALVQNALAGIAFARNDLTAAETGYCAARDLGMAAPDPYHAMIVNDASSCGVVKYYLERPDTLAAIRLASAHAYAHLAPDHPKMGNVLNGAYAVLMQYGRPGEAEPLIRRHLELERSLHSGDADDVYDPLSMLARALEQRGQLAESEALFRAAADMADRLANRSQPYTRGQARLNLANVIARQGHRAEAEVEARGGLERMVAALEPGDSNIGNAKARLASHLARLGRIGEALVLVEEGLAVLEAVLPEGHSEILTARLIRADILARLGRTYEALQEASTAAGQFEERLFNLAASETDAVSLSRTVPAAFGDYLEVAFAAGDMDHAVRAAQLLLLSELAQTNARIGAGAIAQDQGLGDFVDRLDSARGEVQRLSSELATAQANAADNAGAAQAALQTAQAEASEAQRAVISAFPAFASLVRPRLATLAELQSRLKPGEVLVLPVALTDRAITLAIAPDSATWGDTAINPGDLADLTRRLRQSVESDGNFDTAAAHRLFGIVLPNAVREQAMAGDTLLFPASGYLSRLSPAVLITKPAAAGELADAAWLARSHAVRIVPDLAALGDDGVNIGAPAFLGIGAPSLTDDTAPWAFLPPLPTAAAELAALGDAIGSDGATLLTESNATEAGLAAHELAQFRVIAFATHGLVGGEVAGLAEPALVMSTPQPGEASGDGLLTASEIARLQLAADWVILTACNTAAGDGAGSPSYSGLARAFVQAGARGMLLSHWRVRDDAASFLSVDTMRRAATGVPRAEALRQAQMALIARTDIRGAAHPAVWAPFVMVAN